MPTRGHTQKPKPHPPLTAATPSPQGWRPVTLWRLGSEGSVKPSRVVQYLKIGTQVRDEFSEEVKRTLASRVGNVCSNPECRALTSGPQNDPSRALNVGVAAHITAASEGGPRFDAGLSSDERRHAENGIWLCQNCAKLIDNDAPRFTERLLRAWKETAEDHARNVVGKTARVVAETESQKKLRAILPWKGKTITLSEMSSGQAIIMLGPIRGRSSLEVFDCSDYVVKVGKRGQDGFVKSIPLARIEIGFDDDHDRLELQERHE